MSEETDFLRLLQAAISADMSWSMKHGVSPIGPAHLVESRVGNIVKALVWESRILRDSQELKAKGNSVGPVRERVMQELKGQILDRRELKQRIGSCSPKELATVLWQLLNDGSIVMDTNGRYSLTADKNRSTSRV